jgi:hypothetical protein
MNESLPLAEAGSWLVEILLLPGHVFVDLLVTYAPPVADLLALSVDEPGTVAIIATAVIWFAAIVATGTLLTKIREIDRSMTAWIVAVFAECRRQIRVLRRRITATLAYRVRKNAGNADAIIVGAVELAPLETSVLRCLSGVDDGAVLTSVEIAARLDRPEREIKNVLGRLIELELVERRADSRTNKDGLRIAAAGQMYLLGA